MRARGHWKETASGTLYLRKNGVLVGSSSVALKVDLREVRRAFSVTINASDAPVCTWEATLEIAGDPNPANNKAVETTKVTVKSDDDDDREDDD
ncbi:hypothetical protein HZA56_15530, partial [Candidatus Poribacteria bacterium]|nr:hypothetical protein [Candidatus Poribacteria bacterium]